VGSEDFQIAPSGKEWVARGSVEINMPGEGSAQVSGKLRLSADGVPLHYEWSTRGQKKASSTIEFQEGSAKIQLHTEDAPAFTQEFQFDSPRVVILDNNLYHHYIILARLYDWNTSGPQSFPVLIPQDLTPGRITAESLGAQEREGAKFELLKVRSADLEIDLYLDEARRLVRLAVPASKAEVISE
jgi:hypothetical protein